MAQTLSSPSCLPNNHSRGKRALLERNGETRAKWQVWFVRAIVAAARRESNDIAVTVASIEHVDQTRQPGAVIREVGCDHVTYFTTPDALQLLRGALKWPLKAVDGAGALPRRHPSL